MKEVIELLKRSDALLEGHFKLSSGLHSDRYVQCALLLQHPEAAGQAARLIHERWTGPAPEVVLGPAMGGVILGQEVGRAFGIRAIFAERVNGWFDLRRGFAVAPGERVLIAEDVDTTGGSAAEVIELVRRLGAEPVGVVSIVRRTPGNPFSVPYEALVEIIPPTWKPEDCPLCRDGSEAVKPGSRPETGGRA